MNYFSLTIAFLFLLINILLSIKIKNVKVKFFHIVLAMIITLTILVYPLMTGRTKTYILFSSFFYSFQAISLTEDISIIKNISLDSTLNILYVFFIYGLFTFIPLLTVTFILTLIDNIFNKFKLIFLKKKELVVFSEINDRTIAISTNDENINRTKVFINNINQSDTNKITSVKGIKISKSIININLENKKTKSLTYYLFSEDKSKNLEDSLKLIEKYKTTKLNINVYTLLDNEASETMLNSVDKGNVKLKIVNENERVVYNLIDKYPLYLNKTNNTINTLIVGEGNIFEELIKTISWCGKIPDYKLIINILSLSDKNIKEELISKYPELLLNAKFNFINSNLYTKETSETLSKIKNINYIVIASSDDEKNIEYALYLRSLFMRSDSKYENMPVINVLIRKESINRNIKYIKNENKENLNINSFGSISNMYGNSGILDSRIEKNAESIHLLYDKRDISIEKKIIDYYNDNYNVKSSRAAALHLKYKMYSVLGSNTTNNLKEDLIKFEKEKNKTEIKNKLIKGEHERWVAYMRSCGFSGIDAKEAKKYERKTNSHIHYIAKLHPFLTDFDKLKEAGNILSKKDVDKKDEEFIKNIANLLK